MAKLPFVVEPRRKPELVTLGTEDSGKIEIVRKGYLTAGEKSFMQTQGSSDTIVKSMLALAREIAREFKIDTQKAYELANQALQNAEGEKVAKVWEKFEEDLSLIYSEMVRQDALGRIMKCYCLLLYRVDSDFEAGVASELHEDLVNDLVDLYDKEEAKSTERLNRELGLGATTQSKKEESVDVEIEAAEKK